MIQILWIEIFTHHVSQFCVLEPRNWVSVQLTCTGSSTPRATSSLSWTRTWATTPSSSPSSSWSRRKATLTWSPAHAMLAMVESMAGTLKNHSFIRHCIPDLKLARSVFTTHFVTFQGSQTKNNFPWSQLCDTISPETRGLRPHRQFQTLQKRGSTNS